MAYAKGGGKRSARTLTIDPRIRRIGFACFAGAVLDEWRIRNVRNGELKSRPSRLLIPIVIALLDEHKPSTLLMPDISSVRRSKSVVETVRGIEREAVNRNIAVVFVSDDQVRAAFQPEVEARPNKHRISQVIVRWFPELGRWMKPKRKIYEPEWYAQPLFQAVAMYCAWRGIPNSEKS